MAGTSTLANLVVNITGNAGPLRRTLAEVRSELTGFTAAAGGLAGLGRGLFGLAAGLAGTGLAAAAAEFFAASKAAAGLTESLTKVHFTFGESEKAVTGFAEKMADAYGSPKKAILDSVFQFGMIGRALGKNQAEATAFGVAMVKLADDASSLHHVNLDVALHKLSSGLVGMERPLREWGILVDENAVKQEAARMGLASYGTELTQSQKVQARLALITRQLGVAIGDHARTAGSAANQTRKFWGQLENLQTTIGQDLLPLFGQMVTAANRLVSEFAAGWKANTGAVGTFRQAVEDTMLWIANSGDYWKIWQTEAAVAVATVTDVFEQLKSKMGAIWDVLKLSAQSAVVTVIDLFEQLKSKIVSLAGFVKDQVSIGGVLQDILPGTTGIMAGFGAKNILKGPLASVLPGTTGLGLEALFEPNAGGAGDKAKQAEAGPPEFLKPFNLEGGAAGKQLRADLDKAMQAAAIDFGGGGAAKLLREDVARLRGELVKKPGPEAAKLAPAPPWAEPEEEMTKAKKGKAEGPRFLGLEEFSKHVQEGILGKGDAAETTAKNTAATVKKLDEVIQIWKAKGPEPGMAVGPA